MLSITFCKTANKAERCSIEVSSAPQNNSCLAPERSGAFLFAARGELAHPSGANENAGARSARHELFCRPPNRDRRSRPAGAKAIPSPPAEGYDISTLRSADQQQVKGRIIQKMTIPQTKRGGIYHLPPELKLNCCLNQSAVRVDPLYHRGSPIPTLPHLHPDRLHHPRPGGRRHRRRRLHRLGGRPAKSIRKDERRHD